MMNAALEQLIPVAHAMGVRFVETASRLRPAPRCPFEGNGNHFGVIYAGVIFTVAEVLGGAIHFATFDVTTHYPLVRSLTIDFLAPGQGAADGVGRADRRTRSPGSRPRRRRTPRCRSCSRPRSSARTAPWSPGRAATTSSARSAADPLLVPPIVPS